METDVPHGGHLATGSSLIHNIMSMGDSGGPLVCEDEKKYGVVSFKFKADSGGQQIDCYAKIPDYSRWIYLTMTKA
ncbi:Thrombin-like enzyme bhalternin [Dissostichus eleginoides]|uniref:Thrombin-like enzyme bhalternin n=1 Tax=Dissostichus eleginoides TaxID=100907 RepID=A0AAD9CAD9_DISEL|nr:Thrombin-like enzyme bhalternin [Dissostichus eleginoides]